MTPQDLASAFELLAEAPGGVARLRELIVGALVDPIGACDLAGRSTSLGKLMIRRLKSVVPADAPSERFQLWSVPAFDTGAPERLLGREIGSTKREISAGWVLLCKINPHLNRVWHVQPDSSDGRFLASPEWVPIDPTGWHPAFLVLALSSPRICSALTATRQGMGSLRRANLKIAGSLRLWRPPPPEQQRIVARVDELMALLDDLEQAHVRRERTRVATRDSTLEALRSADSPEEMEAAWGRFAERIDDLACAPVDVPQLRQTVLQLAVRGKLVAQSPMDEPVQAFLRRLASRRESLPKSAVRKAATPSDGGSALRTPTGWALVPFGETHLNRDAERVPLARSTREHRQGTFDYYGASGVIDHIDDYLFEGPLLLISEDGANLVLRSTPVAFLARGRFWVNNHAHVLDSLDDLSLEYLAIFINAIDLRPFLTGTAQPKLNQARMNAIPCPFPPLAEQHRIVARVHELMDLLDRLEARLVAERGAQTAFAAAAVHHLDA